VTWLPQSGRHFKPPPLQDIGKVKAMVDNLDIAYGVEEIVSELMQRVRLNKRLCRLLRTTLKDTLNEVKDGTTMFSGSHQCMVILEEVLVVARRVECFVRDCCCTDYVIAAIKAVDSRDRFVKLFADLDFCCVLAKSLNMECGMSRQEIRKYDWEKKMNLRPEVCIAAAEDKREIIGVMRELVSKGLVDNKGDHRKVCQTLLARLTGGGHKPRDEHSQDPPSFEEKDKLENGGQATVFKAKWKGHWFVLKQFKFQGNQDETFENEVRILEGLCHPNILNMVCHYKQPFPTDESESSEYGIIVTEKMSKDLHTFLAGRAASARGTDHLYLPPLETVEIMLQMNDGLTYLHSIEPKVAHRDVKPRNILITENPLVVKVADFGLSKVKSEVSNSEQTLDRGTTKFIAPELLRESMGAIPSPSGEGQRSKWWKWGSKSARDPVNVATNQDNPIVNANNLKADVYSFGITCSVILSGQEPYQDIKYTEVRSAVVGGKRPELPSATPLKLERLLKKCWHKDPNERPSFLEIGKELRELKVELLLGTHA
jgi:serine/threonine protein kinase